MVNKENSDLLSQGGFGCIYYPGIDCSGDKLNNNNYVTKIQVKNYSAENEIYIGNLIKSIENYQNFFLPIINSCPIHANKVKNDVINECEPIQNKDEFVLMKMKYVKSVSFYDILSDNNIDSKIIIKKMVNSYIHLLKSLNLLQKKQIIHYDLKADNILIEKNSETPIIIDFGISFNMNKVDFNNLNNFFYIYAPDYYLWSIDIHIINFLVNEVDDDNYVVSREVFDEIITDIISHSTQLKMFSDNFKQDYKKKCLLYGDSIINKTKPDILKLLIKRENYNTWDNFSLSCIFLNYINHAFNNKFPDSTFLTEFSQILCINISPDPKERLSIKDTISKTKVLISNIKKNDIDAITKSININPEHMKNEYNKSKLERTHR